jgi:hypothetical protein
VLLRITLTRKKEMHMGEIVAFPRQREGCARWLRSRSAVQLAARPACAALAMVFAAAAPGVKT